MSDGAAVGAADGDGHGDGALRFGALDYSSFVALMLLSALVGVYYGFVKKQESVDEYFLGGRNMGVFPIAMSLIATNISGVTMLAVPADIYAYGLQIGVMVFLGVPVVFLVVTLFLPTFYNLQYESSFEYLEQRFCKNIQKLSSVFFIVGAYLHAATTMYVPCLAMHQVSGLSVKIINPITCLVCVFYTCVGGLRAVVWTDALQLASLVLASCVVLAVSTDSMSVPEMWRRLQDGGRLELFNMDLDPTVRATFWNVALGEGIYFLNELGVTPYSVQRYLALPTLPAAKRAAWTLALGFTITRALSCVTGLVMYAYYHDCDPVARKMVEHPDNLVPYFVMEVAADWPGLPGVFIAGVFSAALSTASSVLNTLAVVIYKDFLEARVEERPDEKRASHILKALTLLLGLGIMVLVFIVEQLGGILEAAVSLSGVTTGATFGLFLLGLFVPWAETVGAMCGAAASMGLMTVVCLGGLYAKHSGALRYPLLPTRTDGCNATEPGPGGTTTPTPPFPPRGPSAVFDEDLFALFRLSPFYFAVLGVVVTVVVGASRIVCPLPPPSPDQATVFLPVPARCPSPPLLSPSAASPCTPLIESSPGRWPVWPFGTHSALRTARHAAPRRATPRHRRAFLFGLSPGSPASICTPAGQCDDSPHPESRAPLSSGRRGRSRHIVLGCARGHPHRLHHVPHPPGRLLRRPAGLPAAARAQPAAQLPSGSAPAARLGQPLAADAAQLPQPAQGAAGPVQGVRQRAHQRVRGRLPRGGGQRPRDGARHAGAPRLPGPAGLLHGQGALLQPPARHLLHGRRLLGAAAALLAAPHARLRLRPPLRQTGDGGAGGGAERRQHPQGQRDAAGPGRGARRPRAAARAVRRALHQHRAGRADGHAAARRPVPRGARPGPPHQGLPARRQRGRRRPGRHALDPIPHPGRLRPQGLQGRQRRPALLHEPTNGRAQGLLRRGGHPRLLRQVPAGDAGARRREHVLHRAAAPAHPHGLLLPGGHGHPQRPGLRRPQRHRPPGQGGPRAPGDQGRRRPGQAPRPQRPRQPPVHRGLPPRDAAHDRHPAHPHAPRHRGLLLPRLLRTQGHAAGAQHVGRAPRPQRLREAVRVHAGALPAAAQRPAQEEGHHGAVRTGQAAVRRRDVRPAELVPVPGRPAAGLPLRHARGPGRAHRGGGRRLRLHHDAARPPLGRGVREGVARRGAAWRSEPQCADKQYSKARPS